MKDHTTMSKTIITEGLTPDDVAKWKNLLNSALQIKQEIDDLREGLKDAISNYAEESGIPKKILNDAITTEYKKTLESKRESMDTVEDLLEIAGYGG